MEASSALQGIVGDKVVPPQFDGASCEGICTSTAPVSPADTDDSSCPPWSEASGSSACSLAGNTCKRSKKYKKNKKRAARRIRAANAAKALAAMASANNDDNTESCGTRPETGAPHDAQAEGAAAQQENTGSTTLTRHEVTISFGDFDPITIVTWSDPDSDSESSASSMPIAAAAGSASPSPAGLGIDHPPSGLSDATTTTVCVPPPVVSTPAASPTTAAPRTAPAGSNTTNSGSTTTTTSSTSEPRWGNCSTVVSFDERVRRSRVIAGVPLPAAGYDDAEQSVKEVPAPFPAESELPGGGFWMAEGTDDELPPPSAYEVQEAAYMMRVYNDLIEKLNTTGMDTPLPNGEPQKIYDLT